MEPTYLLAVVATDQLPGGEFMHAEALSSAQVRDRLQELLASHGYLTGTFGNAQMMEEAQTAVTQVDRWSGGPLRLCGYLTRYDLCVLPPGRAADQTTWQDLAASYDRQARRAAAGRRLGSEWHLLPGDPDYRTVLGYLTDPAYDLHLAVAELDRFAALAARPEVTAAIPARYRHWQWIIISALTARQDHLSYAMYEQEVLAEVAKRSAATPADLVGQP